MAISAGLSAATNPAPEPPIQKPPDASIVWKRIEPRPTLTSRAIMDTLLEVVGRSDYREQSAQIETAFENLEAMQDRDPASKTLGNFHWYWRETKPGDLNAVEFITQRAVLVKLLYADRLSPKAAASLDRSLQSAVEGIHRHKVDVAYTNIYLMKTWNLLALGQALNLPDLTREGAAMLDQWMAFTQQNGITEYLSPTYLGIDLDSLGLMARQLADPALKAKASAAAHFFWQSIAANWFEPAQRLGGPHGRDYDYLTGHGELDRHLRDVGWITTPAPANSPPPSVFQEACRCPPPEELHQKAISEIPRFVQQRCGPDDTDWASQQINRHFSIGVAGTGRGPEDKPFALNLDGPAGSKTVMINFFMDGRDDPYGSKKVPTGASGHSKAHHLAPLFRAAQSGADVLFLSSFAGSAKPSRNEAATTCLYSHLDLPEEAVPWSTDQPLKSDLAAQPLPGNLCFLRMGEVAIGIRFLLAEDTSGKPVVAQLIDDGQHFHARRLTVPHSTTPPGEARGTVGVFIRAEEGMDDAGFAAFRKKFAQAHVTAEHHDAVVSLSAEGVTAPLLLDVDLQTGQLLPHAGTETPRPAAPLCVNGRRVDLIPQK